MITLNAKICGIGRMENESILGKNGPPPVVWCLAFAMLGIEVMLTLSDGGWIAEDLRWQVYLGAAFFDVFFEAARAGEAVPMFFWSSFLTHAFLHAGWLHLAMNAVFLLAVGGMVARVLGAGRFLVLFAVTAVAGALALALLTDTQSPLVGASGALFGFLGALKKWEWRYITVTGTGQDRFWRTIAALVAINLLLIFAFPGEGALAWQAHLGGFIAGFAVAGYLAPRLAAQSPI